MANTGMKDGDPEIESLKQEDKVSTLAFFRCICFLVTSRYTKFTYIIGKYKMFLYSHRNRKEKPTMHVESNLS
jgi:hypothetical protein